MPKIICSHFTHLLLATTLLGPACGPTWAELDPSLLPGGNIALENWNLTVPFDAEGGLSRPQTILPAVLAGPNGYSNSQGFYTDADGAVTMWTPLNGAAGGGSAHPRNEFREMIDPSSSAVNWDSFGTAILDAQVRVMQVPSTDGVVIIGQVHGYNSAPLVLVYYRYNAVTQTGAVWAKLQGTPVQGPPFWQYMVASNLKLGDRFAYQIKVERQPNGPAIASVSVEKGPPAVMTMDPSWDTETFYFKAGAYLHSYGTSSTDGARVKFYRLATSHPTNGLLITTNADLLNPRAGSFYSTVLKAKGGVGGGTWRLVSGFPPKGLSLSPDGVISGSPLPTSVSTKKNDFTVQVRDANGAIYSKKFSMVVEPAALRDVLEYAYEQTSRGESD